ncbi:MAG: methyltransferase domain-containing protein [Pirellulales bacterium]
MIERHLQLILAQAFRSLCRSTDDDVLDDLFDELDQLRRSVPRAFWENELWQFAQNHPLCDFLLEDPYTRLAFDSQPSSLAEAELLELACSCEYTVPATDVGRRVFRCTRRLGMRAFQERRQTMVHLIRELLREKRGVRVAMVGCGALRELESIEDAAWEGVQEVVAIDDRQPMLTLARKGYRRRPVTFASKGVSQLLQSDPLKWQPQDLICVPDWCDYAERAEVRELVRCLAGQLKPGGLLFLSARADQAPGSGYRDLFMNWRRPAWTEEDFVTEVARPSSELLADIDLLTGPRRSTLQLVGRRSPDMPGDPSGSAAAGRGQELAF